MISPIRSSEVIHVEQNDACAAPAGERSVRWRDWRCAAHPSAARAVRPRRAARDGRIAQRRRGGTRRVRAGRAAPCGRPRGERRRHSLGAAATAARHRARDGRRHRQHRAAPRALGRAQRVDRLARAHHARHAVGRDRPGGQSHRSGAHHSRLTTTRTTGPGSTRRDDAQRDARRLVSRARCRDRDEQAAAPHPRRGRFQRGKPRRAAHRRCRRCRGRRARARVRERDERFPHRRG